MPITATITGAPLDSELTVARTNRCVSVLPLPYLIFPAFHRCSNPNSLDLYPSDLARTQALLVCFHRCMDLHAAMLP